MLQYLKLIRCATRLLKKFDLRKRNSGSVRGRHELETARKFVVVFFVRVFLLFFLLLELDPDVAHQATCLNSGDKKEVFLGSES